MPLVAADTITSREAAAAMTGQGFYVSRDKLPASDDLYQADIIGLPVFETDKGLVGEAVGIFNFGGGDLLEIKCQNRNIMVPFGGDNPLSVTSEGVVLSIDPVWLSDEADKDE